MKLKQIKDALALQAGSVLDATKKEMKLKNIRDAMAVGPAAVAKLRWWVYVPRTRAWEDVEQDLAPVCGGF